MLVLAAWLALQADPQIYAPLDYAERGIRSSIQREFGPDKPRAACYINGEFYRSCPK
jgi:hypothetical protein